MIPSFLYFNNSQSLLTYSLYNQKKLKKPPSESETIQSLSPISDSSSIFIISPSSSIDSHIDEITSFIQIAVPKINFTNFFREFKSSQETAFGFQSYEYKNIRDRIVKFLTLQDLIFIKSVSSTFNRLIYNPLDEIKDRLEENPQSDSKSTNFNKLNSDKIPLITAKWLIEINNLHQEECYFNSLGEKIEDYTLFHELSNQPRNIQTLIGSYLGIDQVIKISQSFNHLTDVFFEFSQKTWDIQLAESYLNESQLKSIKNISGKGRQWVLEKYLKCLNPIQFEDYLQHISIKTRTSSLPILQKCSTYQLQETLNLASEIGYLDGIRALFSYTIKYSKNFDAWNCYFFQGDCWIELYDQRPILLAFQHAHLNVIHFFEMHGSNIPYITTVMPHIYELDKRRKVVKYYLDKAVKNSSDKQYLTLVLKYAIEVNLYKDVCNIIWNKYSATTRNEFLIKCAIDFNKIKIFKFMYDYWGKVSELSWSNILTFAANKGRLEIVNFLLKECFFGEEILMRAKKNSLQYPEITKRLNEFLDAIDNHKKFRETSFGH